MGPMDSKRSMDYPSPNPRTLRVILLDDGVTVHNASFDRDFSVTEQQK